MGAMDTGMAKDTMRGRREGRDTRSGRIEGNIGGKGYHEVEESM